MRQSLIYQQRQAEIETVELRALHKQYRFALILTTWLRVSIIVIVAGSLLPKLILQNQIVIVVVLGTAFTCYLFLETIVMRTKYRRGVIYVQHLEMKSRELRVRVDQESELLRQPKQRRIVLEQENE